MFKVPLGSKYHCESNTLVERFINFAYFCHPDESDVSHPQRPKPPAEGVGGRDLHGEMPHAVFDGLA